MATMLCVVLSPLVLDGARHKIGARIEIPTDVATDLLAAGIIEATDAPELPSETPGTVPHGASVSGDGDGSLAAPHAEGMHDWPAADAPMEAAPDLDDRIERIREVIRQLDPNDKNLWMTNGAPKVFAIERAFGEDISTAERDAAFAGLGTSA